MIGAAAVIGSLLAAAPAHAQLGVGLGPDVFLEGEAVKHQKAPILPLALAASLAFDATTWAQIQVSTVPARDLSELVRRGYYKLELIEAVLLASRAKTSLKEITAAHDKGTTLRELAQARHLDFDALYEQALALDETLVRRYLPRVMTVTGGPSESEFRRRQDRPGAAPPAEGPP